MRRACIDIGSNTTRLLVADCQDGRIVEVHQERAFTRIGRATDPDGAIAQSKLAEVVGVVAAQLATAHEHGASQVRGVATAAIRRAANGPTLIAEIGSACGLQVEILSSEEEARLAFVGAAGTLGRTPAGELGVVDVGGGSTELVIGTVPERVRWSTSLALGSSNLTDRCIESDPPSALDVARARAEVAATVAGIEVRSPGEAVAVGGSATSLRKVAGPLLDVEAVARSLALVANERASVIANRFAIDLERARLLPAALLLLEAAARLFGGALEIGFGGIREGVLLDAAQA
jgi:exopolyphosphatase / guanosine-5'-triphosphate,3'-diphosphate pyrophosphatase